MGKKISGMDLDIILYRIVPKKPRWVTFTFTRINLTFSILDLLADVRRYSSTSSKSMYGATESDPLNPRTRQQPFNPTFYRAHSDSVLYQDDPPSQLCHVGHKEPCKAAPTASSLGLLVALSIHALLEGLVVGLEESPSKVLMYSLYSGNKFFKHGSRRADKLVYMELGFNNIS